MIVEEETKHLDNEDLNRIDELLDSNKQRDTIAKSILFKCAKSDYEKDGPVLSANPVSFIITNIPSFKGGRSNPWMESEKKKKMGIEDENHHIYK